MPSHTQVDQLLARWQESRRRGEDVPLAELCRDCPELLAVVAVRVEALQPPTTDAATVPPTPPPDAATVPPTPPDAFATQPAADDTPPTPAVPTVAGYEILGELGRGGMGVVYKARQRQLGRTVALKMILAGGHAGAAELERFRTEAEAIARLQHPNIVQIHEVGEQAGLPFFSLEFCPGGSLDRKLAGTPLPPRDAAALVEQLARAMQAAHAKGVLHRDLKPANVLLAEDGTPKVTDFGLAKKLDEQGQTASGAVMGTPSYMAPEQAGGKTAAMGPACDIYALGALLYDCLAGRPPFKAATALDTIMQVVTQEPVPLRQLNAQVPRDLETICLKCLHKDPARRYRTAEELADDLGRYRRGEPIRARPVGRLERLGKWVRRNPGIAGLAAAVLLTLTLGIAVSSYFAIEANAEAANTREANAKLAQTEKEARDSAAAERQAREHAEDLLATSTMNLAKSRFEEGNAALASELLEGVPGKFRSRGWGLLKNYVSGGLFSVRGHTAEVSSVAFSADGKMLASASYDKSVKLWDAHTGQELRTLRGHTNWVRAVAFSADGRVLASASNDQTVKLWEVQTGQELFTLREHTNEARSVAFSANGRVLASGSWDGTVKLWDVRTGRELRTLSHNNMVNSVAFSADGHLLASASEGGTVKLWDANTGQGLRTLRASGGGTRHVAFSADSRVLAAANVETVKLWNAQTGQELCTLHDAFERLAFSPDGRVLASVSNAATVKLWDSRTGQELRTLRGHTATVEGVAFSADGQVLASASWDQTVKLWDVRTGEELHTLPGDSSCLALSADGRMLASVSQDGTVKLSDARTGHELRTLRGHMQPVTRLVFSAGAQLFASAGFDGVDKNGALKDGIVKLWDARTGQELHTLRGHTDWVANVAFSANGQMLASTSQDGTVKLWDVRTGHELRTLRVHANTNVVTGVAFATNGQLLASGSWGGTVKLWDVRTGQELHTLCGHTNGVASVAFSANGKLLASASADGTVKLWDVRTAQELRTLRGHTRPITSVAFSADGEVLASAGEDRTVKLWNAQTGQELRSLRGHTARVISVAFAMDGQVLASASEDQTVKLWDVRTGQESLSLDRERRFRLWVTSPDLHLHRELAEAAARDKQPFALAFRVGRYLAGQHYYATEPADQNAVHRPAFPDGIACAGVLYKDSGIAPARLLLGTTRALEGDASSWLNQALHGGALYRNGEHAKALAALQEAVQRHGKPSPLTHHLLALTYLALGQKEPARDALRQATPAPDAAWEDVYLHRLLQPETAAAFARADEKPPTAP